MFKKKTIISALALAMTANAGAQVTPVSQMEKLDRGVIALPSESSGYLVSWRFLGTDDKTHGLYIIRQGSKVRKILK